MGIPTRFMLTMGHMIAVMMIWNNRADNVKAGVGTDASAGEIHDAKREVMYALIIAAVCFAMDFFGMLCGYSIFFPFLNFFQIVVHFIGGCLASFFVENAWPYQYIWVLVGLGNVTTFIVELSVFLAIFLLKVVVF